MERNGGCRAQASPETMKKRYFPAFLFTLLGLLAVVALATVILTGGASAGGNAAGDVPDSAFAETEDPDGNGTEEAEVFNTVAPVTPAPTPVPTAEPEPTATPTAAPEVNALMRSITKAMGEERDDDVPALLEQLKELDPGRGADWTFLLDYWAETEKEGFIGGNLLPEGLPQDNSLCLIVMGYQLSPKGSMKPELVHRLEVALACAEQYPNAYILVTGGGTAQEKKDATEAGRMARWLKEHGVDKDRILMEDDSTTTGENVKYSYTLLSRRHPEVTSVAIITTDYHIPRCCLFFNARFLMKRSPIRVVANAAYLNDRGVKREPRKTIADGVARMYGVN